MERCDDGRNAPLAGRPVELRDSEAVQTPGGLLALRSIRVAVLAVNLPSNRIFLDHEGEELVLHRVGRRRRPRLEPVARHGVGEHFHRRWQRVIIRRFFPASSPGRPPTNLSTADRLRGQRCCPQSRVPIVPPVPERATFPTVPTRQPRAASKRSSSALPLGDHVSSPLAFQ